MKNLVIMQLISALLFLILEALDDLHIVTDTKELFSLIAVFYTLSIIFTLFSLKKKREKQPSFEV